MKSVMHTQLMIVIFQTSDNVYLFSDCSRLSEVDGIEPRTLGFLLHILRSFFIPQSQCFVLAKASILKVILRKLHRKGNSFWQTIADMKICSPRSPHFFEGYSHKHYLRILYLWASINYVDKILRIFYPNPLPPSLRKLLHMLIINLVSLTFGLSSSPLACQRSLWMPPNITIYLSEHNRAMFLDEITIRLEYFKFISLSSFCL